MNKNKTGRRWTFTIKTSMEKAELESMLSACLKIRFCAYSITAHPAGPTGYLEMHTPIKKTALKKIFGPHTEAEIVTEERENVIAELKRTSHSLLEPFFYGARMLNKGGRPRLASSSSRPSPSPPPEPPVFISYITNADILLNKHTVYF